MPGVRDRRQQLAEAATDYVLEHGLIQLSLRPLADALGTSDRMLIYHFGTKDELVADVLRIAADRATAGLLAIPASPGPRQAVVDLWDQVARHAETLACGRLTVEAAAMGLAHEEPFLSVLRKAKGDWSDAFTRHLARSGVPEAHLERVVTLLRPSFLGLIMEVPRGEDGTRRLPEINDLAEAIGIIAHPIASRGLVNWGG